MDEEQNQENQEGVPATRDEDGKVCQDTRMMLYNIAMEKQHLFFWLNHLQWPWLP